MRAVNSLCFHEGVFLCLNDPKAVQFFFVDIDFYLP